MTGLHEALDDIAAEITPIDPPVELAMRLGGKKRHRRRIAAITGTAGAVALSAITAKAINWLPAYTTKSWALGVCAFPIGGRWCWEFGRQAILAATSKPRLTGRYSAPRSEGTR